MVSRASRTVSDVHQEKLPEGWCQAKLKFIDDILFRFGGIYVREDVIFTHRFDQRYRTFDAVAMGDVHSHQLVIARRRHFAYNDRANYSMVRETFYIMTGDSSMETSRVTLGTAMCQSGTKIRPTKDFLSDTGNYSKPMIFIAVSKITPESIWTLQTAAGRLLRTIMYNKSDVTVAVPSDRRLIPNIAHIIWLNNNTMNFQFYLCVLSLVEVVKVDKLYIHGDGPPTGYYWNLVKDHPKIVLVLRTLNGLRYETIYGDIRIRTMEHMADVWRADILYRHGGLYVDTDVLFFRPLDAEIRSFDTVMSKDVVLSYPFLTSIRAECCWQNPEQSSSDSI
jgi:hypothetical protein